RRPHDRRRRRADVADVALVARAAGLNVRAPASDERLQRTRGRRAMADASERNAADALIVGAGPVGLTAAIALTMHGVRCRIVDRNAARTDKSKALVLWSRSLELLDDLGGAAPFVDAGTRGHGASLYAGAKRLVHA